MLTIHKTTLNRLDIELSAVLDGDMMALALDDLVEKSKDIKNGVMMYKIPSFSMPTGGALVAEMLRLPKLFKVIHHFDVCAVVTDIAWVRTAAEVEGAIIPGLTIKAFASDQEAEAEAWLSQRDVTARADLEEEDDDEWNVPV
ncbi:STAS/SEC14 domain-containing protein [Octadecabacter sp. 1_MG-2023]|uniref:STAS/SEC14 domain-containing protein n=1 Tax=unclassified Octadecabacter TaxID=196158 RepID=UPI001C089214|nr:MULTISPECIES: STAS/SEC14 domain-containing protein [unclassified Octadecabacter]MBU2992926.1 STAS/SEC14 domain-containing protein [Octadecabacter sp. B2R22]MDO6733623.1 STAS/SEC14 domain-containing protein [Octadecabacter sp. 1_MG-2023]